MYNKQDISSLDKANTGRSDDIKRVEWCACEHTQFQDYVTKCEGVSVNKNEQAK